MTDLSTARHQSSRKDEEGRVARMITAVSVMALLFLIGIGLKAWYASHATHAYVLWLFAGVVTANMALYAVTRNRVVQKNGMLSAVALLFAYLIATGGESNTGPLWFYVFPPLLFYLTSLKLGTVLLMGCLLYVAVVFRFPELPFVAAEYDRDFIIRFFATVAFESFFCFVLEASRLKARNELLELAATQERAARTDELTGLANRRDMQHKLANEYARYRRSGHHFSVVLIDLDLFKKVNDDFGHDAGDAVLREFAELVQTVVRQADVAARWGGEEFLVLLPDTSLLQALALAERLRARVEATRFTFGDQTIPVTISAGVCSISQTGTVNDLLKQADINLYSAKDAGRNQIGPRVRSLPANIPMTPEDA